MLFQPQCLHPERINRYRLLNCTKRQQSQKVRNQNTTLMAYGETAAATAQQGLPIQRAHQETQAFPPQVP